MLTSASTYCRPFWIMEMRAAGGTRAPLMFDWLMWLSMPKVKAEWEKPEGGMDNLKSRTESIEKRWNYLNIFLSRKAKSVQSTEEFYR